MLDHGRALILLDGLDEVPQQDINEVLKQLRRLLDKYSNNQTIITCRKAAQEYLDNRFQGFAAVEVVDFDKEQIETFVTKWFKAFPGNSPLQGEYQANQFLNRFSENQKLQELAGIPLLLHLICLVFQETDDFPARRSELYRDALNLLLIKWNKFNKKNIQLDEVERELLIRQLSQIAAITFEQEEFFFKLDRVQQILQKSELASEDWLKSIEARHGLLIKQGRVTYSFSHQTFQEYLAAEALVKSNPPDLENLVKHISDQRWHQVFLLAVDLMHAADELLHQMKKKIDDIVLDGDLQNFLKWANRRACEVQKESEIQYKPAAIRAYYLAIADESYIDIVLANSLESEVKSHPSILLDLALAKTLWCFYFFHEGNYSAMSNIAYWLAKAFYRLDNADINLEQLCREKLEGKLRELTEELPVELKQRFLSNIAILHRLEANKKLCLEQAHQEPKSIQQFKEQTPNPDGDGVRFSEWWLTKSRTWADNLRKVMFEYRDIGQKWQFSRQQQRALYQYHHANRLLVECLNSDCDVSHEVRSQIEDELLLPIAEIEARQRLRE